MSAKKEDENRPSLIFIKQQSESAISRLKSKTDVTQKDLYIVSKNFFKQLLQLDIEFTYDELLEEIQQLYLEKKITLHST